MYDAKKTLVGRFWVVLKFIAEGSFEYGIFAWLRLPGVLEASPVLRGNANDSVWKGTCFF